MLLHREEFLNVIQRAVVIAPADSPLESLECVLLEADHSTQKLTVTATNVELSLEQRLPCKTDRDDALLVNARLLAAMLERLDGDTVSLEHVFDGTTVTLRSGTASYTVAVYTRGGFPKPQLPFPEDTILLRGLPSMARNTVFAAAREKQQTMLSCVHLCFSDAGLQAVSSDGSCMVSARSAASCNGNRSLLLPAVSLQKLARMCREEEEFHVGTTGKSLVLFREDFLFSARLMEGGYINSDQLMQSVTHLFTVLTDVETLQETLLAVTTVHPNGKCCLSFQGTQLELRAAGKAGQAAMAVTVIPLIGTPTGDFWFSARRLLQSLRALSGTATLGMAQGGMLTLSTEQADYLQTAVRPDEAVLDRAA